MSDLGDSWVTDVLKGAFSPLCDPGGAWQVAAVAIAGDRRGLWLSGASPTSSFHIGSVTKTFTALLLATMAAGNEVGLEDPVSRYLPAAAPSPVRLVDLATHTSGYPRLPWVVKRRMVLRLRDPYSLVRDRHVDRALRSLSKSAGPAPHTFVYSNFGYGVLSRALASAGGRPFGELLGDKVLRPLQLDGVTTENEPDPERRRLFGHNLSGAAMEHWRNAALAGAAYLFADIEAMGRYLDANLHPDATPLRVALNLVHEPRQAAGPGMQVALGWLVRASDDGPVYWHNGGTAGFGAFIGFNPTQRLGTAVLMSRRHGPDLDAAAMSVLSSLRRP